MKFLHNIFYPWWDSNCFQTIKLESQNNCWKLITRNHISTDSQTSSCISLNFKKSPLFGCWWILGVKQLFFILLYCLQLKHHLPLILLLQHFFLFLVFHHLLFPLCFLLQVFKHSFCLGVLKLSWFLSSSKFFWWQVCIKPARVVVNIRSFNLELFQSIPKLEE